MTWLRLGLGCTLLLGTALAHAQDDPRTTPDAATDLARGELAPPVAKSSIEVAYPRGATGDASVLLELLITKDGSVADARLLEGEEPFASRALEAARGWEFDPARRGGVSVAARIRARVDFRAPRAGPSPPKQPAPRAVHEPSPAAVSSGDPATADVADVTVRGRRHEVGQTTISRLEVREMPGAFGDGFRAIEALPGVTPTQSGVPYFFVRGAPPNNVGYYLDGVRLPTLFHLGLGGGVIHPGLIERIDFYPGAAPARFGGVAGGVVAAQTRLPALLPRGEVGLRLIDAGALLEVPFANSRGSALVAARYGYPGPIVSQFSDTRLAYWDYQARATWQLAPGHDVGVLLFGSHDRLGHLDDTGELIEDLALDAHRADLRYDHTWERGQLGVAATLGHDMQGANPIYLTDRSAALRLEFEQRTSRRFTARAGLSVQLDDLGLRHEAPEDRDASQVPLSVEPPPTNAALSTYVDGIWRLSRRVEMIPGLRVAVFHTSRGGAADDRVRATVPALEPRLATRVELADRITWVSSLGVSHQVPVLRVGELPVVVAGGSGFSRGNERLQRALQKSHGVELELPLDLSLSVTGFLVNYSGLTDLTASCIQIEPPSSPVGQGAPESGPYFCPSEPVSGHAHGLEFLLRRSLAKRVGGWLSYTLSRSVRDTRFLTLEGTTRVDTVPSEFDRTHVLSGVLTYDLGRRWRAGTRLVLYSGAPYSRLAGSVPAPPYNSLRDSWFVRGDLRLEKRWPLGETGSVGFVFEVQNATLSREANLLGMDCEGTIEASEYTTRCHRGKIGPLVFPSLGVEAVF